MAAAAWYFVALLPKKQNSVAMTVTKFLIFIILPKQSQKRLNRHAELHSSRLIAVKTCIIILLLS